ncbi:MAG: DUF1501 domain-containing protein [Planctomycetaceae bacterium]
MDRLNRLPTHARIDRRRAIQAGAIGLLGLGTNHIAGLQTADASPVLPQASAKSVIFIFLSGGLAQHESFDLKPHAPDTIRGEFLPIPTATPGLQICEHLPLLAQRSEQWSLVRSLTHPHNEHSDGHQVILSGRTLLPPTFNRSKPMPEDWPCIASIVGDQTQARNNLPPAIALPERLIHRTGRVIPGQFGGQMGARRDPWFIEASPFNATTYGAYPEYEFHHARGPENKDGLTFQAPNLSLPQELLDGRLARRLDFLGTLEDQRRTLDRAAATETFDRHRQAAVSLLTNEQVKQAFDVTTADPDEQERYGRNSFGWSLLMARRLIEAGTRLVQVNLGNNEAWDTHGNAFPNLKDRLLPPMDRGVSALLDDLSERGLLDDTLIVMAGEFGRTAKLSTLTSHYQGPGRDHWGAVQSVWLAGGGVTGGRVIGSSDLHGAYPETDPQRPENLAATIYNALGIPPTAAWKDDQGRPHHVYHADPISGLTD